MKWLRLGGAQLNRRGAGRLRSLGRGTHKIGYPEGALTSQSGISNSYQSGPPNERCEIRLAGQRGHAAGPQDNRKEQGKLTAMRRRAIAYSAVWAAGRGDRLHSGAWCPLVNLVSGGCGDIIGGAHGCVPVWEIAGMTCLPRPRSSSFP